MDSLNYFLGGLVLANIGTMVTIIIAVLKFTWFLSKMDSRIEKNETDTNAAHEKIRWIKDKFLTNSNGGYNG